LNFADLVREESLIENSHIYDRMKHSNYSQYNQEQSAGNFHRERISLTHDYFKESTQKLRKDLNNNKIFLNMVIHEMRNPTNQIAFTI
jgi:hypothetical protein